LGEVVITYLDTHVVLWLAAGRLKSISPKIRKRIDGSDLLLSPMVLLEVEYLYELGRCKLRSRDIISKLEHEIGLAVSDLPFADVVSAAAHEKWTRDPFDRMIVAQARTHGLASLISADEDIARHYPRTVW
jgi:PIN domain nuclease of toxin-antitoxin system